MSNITRWTINGYDMHTDAIGISDRSGWDSSASSSGQTDLAVHNRPGVLWAPKHPSVASFSLNFWLAGKNEWDCFVSWENLLRAVYSVGKLATVRRDTPDGDARLCEAELTGAVEPTWVGRTGMKGTLRFTIPSGAWVSLNRYSFSTPSSSLLPKTLELPELARSTTQIRDIVMVIRGPLTNATVINTSPSARDESVTYAGTIPAGEEISLDARQWRVTSTAGFTPNRQAVSATGPAFMAMDPVLPGQVHSLQLQGSGGGARTQLRVSARAAFS